MKRFALFLPALPLGGGLAFWALRAVPVVTTIATRGPAIEAVYATGTVEADPRVVVKAKIPGTVAALAAKEGERVTAGQLLAVIDNKTLKYDLKRTRADLRASAERSAGASPQTAALQAARDSIAADLKLAETELGRAEALATKGALARDELDRRRERASKLRAEWAAADARLRSLAIDLRAERERLQAMEGAVVAQNADAEVRAPIDGTVIQRRVEMGEALAVGQPLFVVGNTDHLLLEVKIDEVDVGRIRIGQEVLVDLHAYADRVVRGRLVELLPDADRATKTFLGKVTLTSPPEGLRSGMSAEVNIIVAQRENVVLVPTGAVIGGRVRLVVDNRIRERSVQTGLKDTRTVEVVSGLAPGDRVVVVGPQSLADGTRVRAKDGLPPEPPRRSSEATTLR